MANPSAGFDAVVVRTGMHEPVDGQNLTTVLDWWFFDSVSYWYAMSRPAYLDELLDCPTCGKIKLAIPDKRTSATKIACSDCGTVLGTWAEIKRSFRNQEGEGVFEVRDGRFKRK